MITNLASKNFCQYIGYNTKQFIKTSSFVNNPLKPLEKDTVSFKSSAFKRDGIKYYLQTDLPNDNSYKIIYYEDVGYQIKPDGKLPYAPYHIEFAKPIEMEQGLDICERYLFDCDECYMKDRDQISTLKEFMSETGVFKNEKLSSMIDAMNNTLVLDIGDNRVLKMTTHEPFVNGRKFEPSFDIPLLSDIYKYKDYYIFIQEKAETDLIEDEDLDSVIQRIEDAGYKPFDIKGNTSQIGWSELMQDYMLIDSECALKDD